MRVSSEVGDGVLFPPVSDAAQDMLHRAVQCKAVPPPGRDPPVPQHVVVVAIDAPTANIAASRCRGCFSGHYEHIGGAWDHHRPRVVPFPKRVKKTWPSTAYSFAPPDPLVPIQVPTPAYLGPARGWSRWRGVPGRYYGNPFCLSGPIGSVGRGPRARDGPMLRGVLTQATTKRVHSKGLVVVVHGVRVVLVPAVVRGLARLVLPGLLDDLAHAPVVLAAVLRVEPRRLAVRGRRRVRVRQ